MVIIILITLDTDTTLREDVREEVYQLPAWVASRTLIIVVSPVFQNFEKLAANPDMLQ